MRSKWTFIFAGFIALPVFATHNDSKLAAINNTIASIQTDLQQSTVKKSQLQNALAKTEINENDISQHLKTTQETLTKQQQKLQELHQQAIPLSATEKKNRQLLRSQIAAAYLFHQAPYLKVLLAPGSTAQKQRILMYLHYITQAQVVLMHQLQQSLLACQRNQEATQQTYKKLLTTKQAQLHNQLALHKTQLQRQQLIQVINKHIQTKHEKLLALLQDKQALERTIEQLTRQTQEVVYNQFTHVPNLPFGRLMGKLTWPTQGSIRHAFGAQVYQSELRWDGTLIAAPQGRAIHAIAAGRVIFAKWMPGYGLLLIINQGRGYMTLYGRAQTLTKNVGDDVKANEVIGTVGKSGGFTHPALYFSVRHDGIAINPAKWCR